MNVGGLLKRDEDEEAVTFYRLANKKDALPYVMHDLFDRFHLSISNYGPYSNVKEWFELLVYIPVAYSASPPVPKCAGLCGCSIHGF